jgi:hypothetical protein
MNLNRPYARSNKERVVLNGFCRCKSDWGGDLGAVGSAVAIIPLVTPCHQVLIGKADHHFDDGR